jgi:glycosyltransferase involved in cell wall biosynthesis
MMATPTVSVLVTSHNLERFIREALESIRVQTCQDFELIIVDDASSDATAARIQAWIDETGFPAHFTRNPKHRGLCGSLNDQLAIARGRFVCFLDHDDAYEPDRIERQLTHLRHQSTEVAAVYSDARIVNADGRTLYPSFLAYHLGNETLPAATELFTRLLLRGNFLPSSGVMVRRQALDIVGQFDERLFYEDYDMWLKLSHVFRIDYLEGSVLKYRLMPDSMSRSAENTQAMLASESRILRSWLPGCGCLQSELLDRLWKLGSRQLDRAFYDDARETFEAVAVCNRDARRRVAVGLLGLPGTPAAVSVVRRGYQFARRGTTGVARLAKRFSES